MAVPATETHRNDIAISRGRLLLSTDCANQPRGRLLPRRNNAQQVDHDRQHPIPYH